MIRSPLHRKTGLKPFSKKRQREMKERAKVRHVVLSRDGFTCQAKALLPHVPCFGGLEAHHWIKASAGGPYQPDNLLTLCQRHNQWVEDEPLKARELGLAAPENVRFGRSLGWWGVPT